MVEKLFWVKYSEGLIELVSTPVVQELKLTYKLSGDETASHYFSVQKDRVDKKNSLFFTTPEFALAAFAVQCEEREEAYRKVVDMWDDRLKSCIKAAVKCENYSLYVKAMKELSSKGEVF